MRVKDKDKREEVLIRFLREEQGDTDVALKDIVESSYYNGFGVGYIRLGTREMRYVVMTDDEATKAAEYNIRNTMFAFNAQWIADFVPDGIDAEHIKVMKGDKCEEINDAMIALVEAGKGMDRFVEASIAADGREHFLNSYDGNEYDLGGYIIIRV